MPLFRIRDRSNFWQFVHRAGVPHIKAGPRKILFEEQAVRAWLDRRTVGSVKEGGAV